MNRNGRNRNRAEIEYRMRTTWILTSAGTSASTSFHAPLPSANKNTKTGY